MPSTLRRTAALAAALAAAGAASAQEMAGAPQGYGPPADLREAPVRHAHHRHAGQCYAQVRIPGSAAPPPTGPEYIWRQAPAPPGAPGPVWCLTEQAFPAPVAPPPARLGWIRVLCADEATPARVRHVQRRLRERGYYRGEIDGRYDEATASAVSSFQVQSRIEDRGYLGYQTLGALDQGPPPPPPICCRRNPTTFERGYLSWPGKSRYW